LATAGLGGDGGGGTFLDSVEFTGFSRELFFFFRILQIFLYVIGSRYREVDTMVVENNRLAGDTRSIRERTKKAEKEKEKEKVWDDEITVTTTGIPRESVTSHATSLNRTSLI
jgi:hypothetical protein